MNLDKPEEIKKSNKSFLMALHSCSDTLGVAIIDSRRPRESLSSSTFPIGRSLSNNLLNCVEEVLPSSFWPQLGRLSVAIGPGGFTGTRLTVVMARTLAQQLDLYLDGVSSFNLMAPRLATSINPIDRDKPFWIVKDLPRRGIIGGKYQIKKNLKFKNSEQIVEIEKPHLLSPQINLECSIQASDNVAKDVVQLIEYSLLAYKVGEQSEWKQVLPIYPTSPVKNIH